MIVDQRPTLSRAQHQQSPWERLCFHSAAQRLVSVLPARRKTVLYYYVLRTEEKDSFFLLFLCWWQSQNRSNSALVFSCWHEKLASGKLTPPCHHCSHPLEGEAFPTVNNVRDLGFETLDRVPCLAERVTQSVPHPKRGGTFSVTD